MSLRELTTADIDIWLVDPGVLRDPALFARYRDLMSEAERERYSRISHEPTRDEFLVARALVRTTLSRYAAVEPSEWRFEPNAFGKPALAAGQAELDLRFNLSHSRGLVACAVTLGRAVGIDVEWNLRNLSMLDSIEHFFSPTEVKETLALPLPARLARFFQCWTLKESYIKAHGLGLSMPLADFSFQFDPGDARPERTPGKIAARLQPSPGDSADRWRVWVWNPTDEHTLGLTAEFAPETAVHLRVESVVP
jgi:4'-phosphopantetheinyl transferase